MPSTIMMATRITDGIRTKAVNIAKRHTNGLRNAMKHTNATKLGSGMTTDATKDGNATRPVSMNAEL
jgi:hypothetical protein